MENSLDEINPPSAEPNITWKDEYMTGHAQVDYQHQYFAGLINNIKREFLTSDDPEYKEGLLWELVKYTDFHFLSEENIMRKLGCSDLEQHRKLHEEISIEMSQKVQLAMADMVPSDEIIDFLVQWFITHTVTEDKLSFANK